MRAKKMSLTAVLVFTAALSYQGANAIKCHNCDSTSNSWCDDPYDSEKHPAVTCGLSSMDLQQELAAMFPGVVLKQPSGISPAENSTECVKIELSASGQSAVLRLCTNIGADTCPLAKKTVEQGGGKLDFCETCTTDGCNSASSLQFALTLLTASLGVLFKAL